MKRFTLYTVFYFLSAGLVHSQSLLDNYVQVAEKNNPGLKAKYAAFEAAIQQIPQVSSLEDPTFTVAAFGQMVETRVGQQMARLSLSQMFPWFGTLAAKKNVAAAQAESAYQSFLDARAELDYRVRSAYYPLVELQQLIDLQQENLDILSTYKAITTSKFQNGKGSLSDALRVDILSNDASTEIQILEDKKKPLAYAFNKLLNRDENEAIELIEAFALPGSETISKDSILNHPKLQELRNRTATAIAQENLALKQGLPKLGLGFEYIITAERQGVSMPENGKDAYMPMFTVSLPIYRKKYKSAVKEAQLMQSAFTEMEHDTENMLMSEYEMVVFELDRMKRQIELFDKQSTQTQQIINLSLTAFSNSESGIEEILRLQQQLVKYKINKVAALRDYHTARAKLIYITGID